MTRFSEKQVSEIRKLANLGVSRWELARRFNSTTTTIGKVINRVQAYKDDWIPVKERTERKRKEAENIKEEIISMYDKGFNSREIAAEKRVSFGKSREIIEEEIRKREHNILLYKERQKKGKGRPFVLTGRPRKLNEEQIKEMRALWDSGKCSCWELGRIFGVHRYTAYKVILRKGAYRCQQTSRTNDLRHKLHRGIDICAKL